MKRKNKEKRRRRRRVREFCPCSRACAFLLPFLSFPFFFFFCFTPPPPPPPPPLFLCWLFFFFLFFLFWFAALKILSLFLCYSLFLDLSFVLIHMSRREKEMPNSRENNQVKSSRLQQVSLFFPPFRTPCTHLSLIGVVDGVKNTHALSSLCGHEKTSLLLHSTGFFFRRGEKKEQRPVSVLSLSSANFFFFFFLFTNQG